MNLTRSRPSNNSVAVMLERENSYDPDLGLVAPLRVPRQLTRSCSIQTDHVGNANLPMCDLNSIHVKLDSLSVGMIFRRSKAKFYKR
jgi:hypothetical protein